MLRELIDSTRFVQRLVERYNVGSRQSFVSYLETLLASTERVIENSESLTTKILAGRVNKPRRLRSGHNTVLGLRVLLGNLPDTVYFPSRYYVTYIENALGKSIDFELSPEIILPFRYTGGFRVTYNPKEHVIYSKEVYEEMLELYKKNPKAVFIVSKFIEWKGFFRFARMLGSLDKLPITFIVTSDPILPEIAEKYNLVRIQSKSHAKVLLFVWENMRLCYIGSMNVLSPSNYNDYLLTYPGLENYCMEFLITSIV